MNVRVVKRWRTFEARMRRGQADNLRDAALALLAAIKADIAFQGHPGFHSDPGDPPFRQSGDLIKSYTSSVDRQALMAWVGSPLDYALFLEDGTARMAARPHIRRNLYGNPAIPLAFCKWIKTS